MQGSHFLFLVCCAPWFPSVQGHSGEYQTTNLAEDEANTPEMRSAWKSSLLQGEITDGSAEVLQERPELVENKIQHGIFIESDFFMVG